MLEQKAADGHEARELEQLACVVATAGHRRGRAAIVDGDTPTVNKVARRARQRS
jgi:hypothetical protein